MRRRGFTLIELLVVVGIIVILLAILVPSLGHFKLKAAKTQCMALLSNLSSSISAYHARFGAYPGPAPQDKMIGNSRNINGAQNMLLGLSYSIGASGGESLGTNPRTFTDITKPNGPQDLGTIRPDGTAEQLSAFFTVSPNQVASQSPLLQTRVGGFLGNPSGFPVVVDNFSDALPILYFRRTAGVDTPAVSPTRDANKPTAYVMDENSDIFTSSGLTAVGGRTCPQNTSVWSGMNTNAATDFQKMVTNAPGSTSPARGGFLLVSSGPDRIYGPASSGGANDDVVLVGGD